LCEAMRTHTAPRPSEIVQRFKFNSRVRSPGESITAYMAALRQLAEYCNFGDRLEEMLRDRLVCGVNEVKIQRRLLAEANLTYKTAVDIAIGMEVASRNAQELQHSADMKTAGQDVNRLRAEVGQQERKAGIGAPECYRCGGKHEASECKFRDAECHKCKKRGHIARKCQSRVTVKPVPGSRRYTSQRSQMGRSTIGTHFVEDEEREQQQDSEPVYSLFKLQRDKSENAYRVTMTVNGVQCDFRYEGWSDSVERKFISVREIGYGTPDNAAQYDRIENIHRRSDTGTWASNGRSRIRQQKAPSYGTGSCG